MGSCKGHFDELREANTAAEQRKKYQPARVTSCWSVQEVCGLARSSIRHQGRCISRPCGRQWRGAAEGQIGSGGNLLVVPASMPVKDLSEFIAYVKGKPAGSLSYGSWGNGSGGHLSMEALLQKTGLKMAHVPYKAVTASLTDLGGGLLQAAFAPMATVFPMVQAGRFKAIAVSGPYRVPQLPDVRTMTEQGVPFDLEAYFAFIAPSSMSREVVSRLNLEINRLLFAPEMQEKVKSLGFSAIPRRTPEEFASRIEKDLQEWGAIVKSSNITVD